MDKKKCAKCEIEKSFDDFNKCKTGRLGLHNHCRDCQKIVRRQWYLSHQEEEKAKTHLNQTGNPEWLARRKELYHTNPNKEEYLENLRKYNRTPKARTIINNTRNKRMKNDIEFKISTYLRNRVKAVIKGKGTNKAKKTLDLLGCSLLELKLHLESKFEVGMSWDNYGFYGWHIDHIIPCSKFDLTKPEEQVKCFHYTNLQPLWAQDNLRKGNKLENGTDSRGS